MKVMLVEWDDHAFGFGDEPPAPAFVQTVGWLVEENDEHIIIALSLSDDRPHEMQLIDKRMMVRKKEVAL